MALHKDASVNLKLSPKLQHQDLRWRFVCWRLVPWRFDRFTLLMQRIVAADSDP
jgi:hypothetical protein